MGRLSIWGAVVRVPVARLQKFTGMGRLRRDAAAELIRRLNIFKFIFFLAPGVDAKHPEEDEEGTVLYLHSLLSRESRAVHVQATLVELVLGGRARVEQGDFFGIAKIAKPASK